MTTAREALEMAAGICRARANEPGGEGQDTQLADHELYLCAERILALRSSVQEEPAARVVELLREVKADLTVRADMEDGAVALSNSLWLRLNAFLSTLQQSAQSSERNKTAEALHTGLGMDDLEIGDE